MTSDEPHRPDPDALLAEAARQGRGRLKVYLGMAPGVGKTYEMLTSARVRAREGVDVVIGVVETHGVSLRWVPPFLDWYLLGSCAADSDVCSRDIRATWAMQS